MNVTVTDFNYYFANEVTGDAWMPNFATGSQGALGMNINSTMLESPLLG